MRKKLQSCLLLVSLLLCTTLSYAASPLNVTLSAGFISDSNITRAELDDDILEDSIINAATYAVYAINIDKTSSVHLTGNLELNFYQDFDKLNNIRLGLGASYRLQPDTHYTAPWYSASFKYQAWDYSSDMRSSSVLKLDIGLGKRLTDKVELRAGLEAENRDADSLIFDTDNTRLYVNLDFKLTTENTLYTSLFYNDGDIVSTVKDSSPTAIKLASKPWQVDDAFPSTWWSYKLDATTTGLSIGNNHALSSVQSIDISVLYYSASAYGGSDYTGLIAELRYFYRF